MNDTGALVLGWLTKIVITLALLGLLAFDGIALVVAGFTAADHANTAASIAADTYKATPSDASACAAAQAEALRNRDTLDCTDPKAFAVTADGHVNLTLHRAATTLWMHRISFLKKYTDLTGHGEGSPEP